MRLTTFIVILTAFLSLSCGYHVAGRADILPKSVRTIYITPFYGSPSQYKFLDSLPNAIGREFISRTRYGVVTDSNEADALLTGSVVRVDIGSQTYDPVRVDPSTGKMIGTGRATSAEIILTMAVRLADRYDGKVLYENPALTLRGSYEIAVDPAKYFDESSTAVRRISQDAARAVVSAVLEAF